MNEWSKIATTAERLRIALDNVNMRPAELSRLTGLSKGAIHHYLAGTYEPKANAINKMAVALSVAESWLWGYDVPRERSQMQKKNDQLVKLVVRMRSDSEFAKAVSMLDNLSPAKFSAIVGMLSTMNE